MLSDAPKVPISDETVNDLLIGALGAVLAWGMIDGIMYALTSVFERGERHRLLRDIQAAQTEQEALDIIAEDMDYLLEPIADEDVRKALYSSIFIHLQNSAPRNIGLKREDISGVLGHVLVAMIAVIPSVILFLCFGTIMNLPFVSQSLCLSLCCSFLDFAGGSMPVRTRGKPAC